jgi:hypothetical protein
MLFISRILGNVWPMRSADVRFWQAKLTWVLEVLEESFDLWNPRHLYSFKSSRGPERTIGLLTALKEGEPWVVPPKSAANLELRDCADLRHLLASHRPTFLITSRIAAQESNCLSAAPCF